MKCLNDKELAALFALLESRKGERNSIMIRLVLFTGARCTEALGVTKADLRQGAIFIRGLKGSSNRTIPVPADFFKELEEYSANLGEGEVLFKISRRHFRRIWDEFRTNPDLGLHSLRHTFGVRLYNNTKDIHAVKTALGHKNINNTMVYLDYVESVRKLKSSTKGMWKKKLDVA